MFLYRHASNDTGITDLGTLARFAQITSARQASSSAAGSDLMYLSSRVRSMSDTAHSNNGNSSPSDDGNKRLGDNYANIEAGTPDQSK